MRGLARDAQAGTGATGRQRYVLLSPCALLSRRSAVSERAITRGDQLTFLSSSFVFSLFTATRRTPLPDGHPRWQHVVNYSITEAQKRKNHRGRDGRGSACQEGGKAKIEAEQQMWLIE